MHQITLSFIAVAMLIAVAVHYFNTETNEK